MRRRTSLVLGGLVAVVNMTSSSPAQSPDNYRTTAARPRYQASAPLTRQADFGTPQNAPQPTGFAPTAPSGYSPGYAAQPPAVQGGFGGAVQAGWQESSASPTYPQAVEASFGSPVTPVAYQQGANGDEGGLPPNSVRQGTAPAYVPPAPAVDGEHGPTNLPSYSNPATPTTTPSAAPKAEEKPKYPSVRITGFFQLDDVFFDQDPINMATVGDIDNGLGFRRARLAATGNVTEDTTYLMEFDFAQAQGRFVDVWMNFANVPVAGNVRLGRFRQPFGMSELTSVRELPFLERPSMFALAPFRQTGLMAYDHNDDKTMTYAISGYRYLSDNFGNVFGDNGGFGMSSRVTYLPYIDECDEKLIHVGFDYSYNDAARNLVQFASQPEVFVGQNPGLGPAGLDALPLVSVPPFVNTGAMNFESSNLFNIEAAAKFHSLVVQSEMRWAAVDQFGGASNTFPGFYAHARYILTGETLPYVREGGVFGRVIPDNPVKWGTGCGCGAWELAARISYLDLNGADLPGPGRRLTDTTLGVNWYLNRYTKMQFNYIHANLDDPTLGESDAHIFATRAQIDF